MFPYATTADVEIRWRPFLTGEEDVAEVLIQDAADIIRTRWADVDARIAAESLQETTVVRVIAGMVRRAMMNRDSEGVAQTTETAGPFSQTAKFANADGNLYLSAQDVKDLSSSSHRSHVGWLA